MKRPEYVWTVTSVFAAALKEGREPTAEEVRRLEAAFSRQGFTAGYYDDRKGPAMFGWRAEGTKDPEDLFREARQIYTRGEHRRTPVFFSARIRAGTPVSVTVRDEDGHEAAAEGPVPEPARTRPVTAEQIAAQLGKTGGTVYETADTEVNVDEGLSLPLSAVNALRREALAKLDGERVRVPDRRLFPYVPLKADRGPKAAPAFSLSFRRWGQLSPACLERRTQREGSVV